MKQLAGMPKTKKLKNLNKNHPNEEGEEGPMDGVPVGARLGKTGQLSHTFINPNMIP